MLERIKQLAKQYASEFIEVRHHLHAHPELSYQEFETSKFVQQKLSSYNIPFEVKATTGVVGLIEGKNPSSRIVRSEEHTSELQSRRDLVCRLLLEKKKKKK